MLIQCWVQIRPIVAPWTFSLPRCPAALQPAAPAPYQPTGVLQPASPPLPLPWLTSETPQCILANQAPLPSLPLALEGREERQGLDLRRCHSGAVTFVGSMPNLNAQPKCIVCYDMIFLQFVWECLYHLQFPRS